MLFAFVLLLVFNAHLPSYNKVTRTLKITGHFFWGQSYFYRKYSIIKMSNVLAKKKLGGQDFPVFYWGHTKNGDCPQRSGTSGHSIF